MLVEYFVLNIYTEWMLLTKEKIYWLIIKKQIKKTLIISFSGQNKANSSI